jgi:hypothetical protein
VPLGLAVCHDCILTINLQTPQLSKATQIPEVGDIKLRLEVVVSDLEAVTITGECM